MGCSPSMIKPEPCGKQPLACSNVFIDAQNFKYHQRFNSPDNENNNETYDHHLDKDNNNDQVNNTVNHNKNLNKKHKNVTFADTDSENVILSEEERHFTSNQSPLNVQLFRNHYHSNSVNDSDSLHNQRKSVLKSSANGIQHDHMLSNRPLKTVTFVDSVTVITVF